MSSNTFAIFYHPDGYDVKNHQLMGRRAAGKSFLSAWVDRQGAETLYCYAHNRKQFAGFCEVAKARGATGAATFIPHDNPEALRKVGALYYPGPDIATHAWRRFKRAPNAWSLIGVTHTICTKTVMSGITEWATAPVEPWDAVICTSKAAQDSIRYQIAAEREHLARRLGATQFTDPQLPIIPLGIHTDDFAPDADLRARTRATLDIGEDEIAILYLGRLDRFGKAHPSPMFIAVERAAAATGAKVRLVMAGSFVDEKARDIFLRDAAHWAPNIKLQLIDGRDEALCAGAWRAGDIFLSLVDNVQETFGLTPVEAMAAGLPCIVSDWNGYRDTVRDGMDGYRIPTLIPPPALGEGVMDRYAADVDGYPAYMALSSSMVAVNIEAAAAALAKLLLDMDLRQAMGASGRKRAVESYDWRVVLNDYQTLLDELAQRRAAAQIPDGPRRWPARLSPYEMFGNFATQRLQGGERVRLVSTGSEQELAYMALAERGVIENAAAFVAASTRLIAGLRGQENITVTDLLKTEPDSSRGAALRTLLLLAKFGVIAIG